MKRLTVLLLAVTFAGSFLAQNRALGQGGDYPRPLGLDWEMTEAEIIEIIKNSGWVAAIAPKVEETGEKGYKIQPGDFAGYKTKEAGIWSQ